MPSGSDTVPACNRIVDFEGPNADDACPKGKPDIVFSRGGDFEKNFGNGGPCSGNVRG